VFIYEKRHCVALVFFLEMLSEDPTTGGFKFELCWISEEFVMYS